MVFNMNIMTYRSYSTKNFLPLPPHTSAPTRDSWTTDRFKTNERLWYCHDNVLGHQLHPAWYNTVAIHVCVRPLLLPIYNMYIIGIFHTSIVFSKNWHRRPAYYIHVYAFMFQTWWKMNLENDAPCFEVFFFNFYE